MERMHDPSLKSPPTVTRLVIWQGRKMLKITCKINKKQPQNIVNKLTYNKKSFKTRILVPTRPTHLLHATATTRNSSSRGPYMTGVRPPGQVSA